MSGDMYRKVRGEPGWESGSEQGASDSDGSSSCSSSCSSHSHSLCDTCSSSFSTSSSSITPPWEAYIKPSGELFYVSLSEPSLYGMGRTSVTDTSTKEKARSAVSKDGKAKSTSRWVHFLKTKKRAAAAKIQSASQRDQSPPYIPSKAKNSTAAGAVDDEEETYLLYESWKLYSVNVRVDLRRRANLGRKTSLCEALLGFLPSGDENPRNLLLVRPHKGQRVFVGLILPEGAIDLPDSPVKPGDWFYKFDGHVVTSKNLPSLLGNLAENQVVQLDFRRNPKNELSSIESSGGEGSSRISNPRPLTQDPFAPPVLPEAVYGLALLSTEGMREDSPDRFDIRYQWPAVVPSQASEPNKSLGIEPLLKVRGILNTLDHLLPEVVGSGPQCSALELNGTLTYLSYLKIERMLSVLAVPASWTNSHDLRLRHMDIHRLLACQYGSLSKTFGVSSQSSELDNLLRTLLEPLAAPQAMTTWTLTSSVSHIYQRQRFVMAPYLPLSPELQFDVESALNELESADYQECEDDCLPERRDYIMVGSCLYYKGYMLTHTLPTPDMEDVTLVLSGTKLLSLTARTELNQAVLWREIFPTEPPPYVKHLNRRYFLLCVGRGQMLLAVLLESGGCGRIPETHPSPDSFLVEQIEWTLDQLEGMRLPALCCKSLSSSLVLQSCSGIMATPEALNSPLPSIQTRLLKGSTTLFHFVDLQTTLGIFVAPNYSLREAQPVQQLIWSQFRTAASCIQQMFQRTLHGKENLKKCDLGGPWVQKDLIALKEVSLLFSIPKSDSPLEGEGGGGGEDKKIESAALQFWVTGRLFLQPTLRELFICYEDSAPQNSIEIAYHLAAGLAP